MDPMERLKLCYDNYFHLLELLPEKYPRTAGLLGFGRGPKDDPCHDQFYESLEETVTAMLEDGVSEETAREAVNFMLRAEDENDVESSGSLMLAATQGQALPLIGFLTREDAAALLAWYEKRYPKRTRLPVQNQVVQALRKQAK